MQNYMKYINATEAEHCILEVGGLANAEMKPEHYKLMLKVYNKVITYYKLGHKLLLQFNCKSWKRGFLQRVLIL